jgi:flagellar biosynthesis/type III secretory pathway protein FliH
MSLTSLPSFDDPVGDHRPPMKPSAVLKSAQVQAREKLHAEQQDAALAAMERELLAEQERAHLEVMREQTVRAEQRSDTARRAVHAVSELAARMSTAREIAVATAASDTLEAAAALAAWYLRSTHVELPAAASVAALTDRVRDALTDMLPTIAPVISVSPHDFDAVGELLGEAGSEALELRADAALSSGEARIDAGQAAADLTIGGALRRAVDHLLADLSADSL